MDQDDIDVSSCATLLAVMRSVASRSASVSLKSQISALAGRLLEHQVWEATDRKVTANHFPTLLRMRINLAVEPFSAFQELIPGQENKHIDITLKVLIDELQKLVAGWRPDEYDLHPLMTTFATITQRCRQEEKLFGPLMRCGRIFAEGFAARMIPYLEHRLKTERQSCIGVIREFQRSTRVLQHLCSHAKLSKDATLTQVVPGLKRALERVIFRVKRMLEANSALGSFWVGNLKHRNLQGEVVPSQVNYEDEEKSDEERDDDLMGEEAEEGNEEDDQLLTKDDDDDDTDDEE